MTITLVFFIINLHLLITSSSCLETQLLYNVRSLTFNKGSLTTGDRFGHNKQDQLNCFGNLDYCKDNPIDVATCFNKGI